ncbi:DUF1694 domain-containing protein [Lactobacillus sp. CBA3606]|uniref:YueI family protein n=1 Tax=Lactobacillus sp. CBA3606 TaxID=2099789 RepID=UPI000CFABB3D|nr:YueI family protein [Lactobacillus sp. CBA3606]AVK64031.1 DUF1694 domain-containing protein [Lactobacillus sp. CBA3606]
MSTAEQNLDPHLQNAIWGLPLLRPDEQHRCLGTFYERIDLKITFEQALQRDFSQELLLTIQQHPERMLLLHGKLDADILGRYVKLAHQTAINFAIKSDIFYHHDRNSVAIILCANTNIDYQKTDITQRFPTPVKPKIIKKHHWFT